MIGCALPLASSFSFSWNWLSIKWSLLFSLMCVFLRKVIFVDRDKHLNEVFFFFNLQFAIKFLQMSNSRFCLTQKALSLLGLMSQCKRQSAMHRDMGYFVFGPCGLYLVVKIQFFWDVVRSCRPIRIWQRVIKWEGQTIHLIKTHLKGGDVWRLKAIRNYMQRGLRFTFSSIKRQMDLCH